MNAKIKKMKSKKTDNIFDCMKTLPPEVQWHMQTTMVIGCCFGNMTGSETINKLIAIERKYPKYFPWRAKYDSVPDSVHEAYIKEKYPPLMFEPIGNSGLNPDDLLADIQKVKVFELKNTNSFTPDDMMEMITATYEQDRIRMRNEQMQLKEDKALWDKHYAKYGLEYRKGGY